MEKVFKVLMYNNQYVDENLLHKGIYTKDIPSLHDIDTTIESLMRTRHNISKLTNMNKFSTNAVEKNLEECELVNFILVQQNCIGSSK